MINANKVKVSKEVAEAIEFLKSGTCQIGPLCAFLDNEKVSSHPKHRKIFFGANEGRSDRCYIFRV